MSTDTTTILGTLAVLVGTRLKAKGLVIATAESCTGGWVGQELTAVAGSSEYYDRGFITYSNAAKQELLRVPADTLRDFGAVSEETARAMASGTLANSRAQISLSITGVAGPGGGSGKNPVGTVCFGWAAKDAASAVTIHSVRMHFEGDREAVRRQSVIFALQGVVELLDRLDKA